MDILPRSDVVPVRLTHINTGAQRERHGEREREKRDGKTTSKTREIIACVRTRADDAPWPMALRNYVGTPSNSVGFLRSSVRRPYVRARAGISSDEPRAKTPNFLTNPRGYRERICHLAIGLSGGDRVRR